MKIGNINSKYFNNYNVRQYKNNNLKTSHINKNTQNNLAAAPISNYPIYNISFCAWVNPNRLAGDVDIETYHIMTEKTKERYRKLYEGFSTNDEIDQNQLFDKKSKEIPLKSDEVMEKFIKASQIYLNYKDQPIICLGRSPKWFLNTAYWMKDGVPDYKFVAFSRYWFYNSPIKGMTKLKNEAPTEEEELTYRKYLDRIGVNPKTIVETMQKEGKKTVITDYVCSGKGVCSFLDVLSRYANDLGILEEFSKSIQIVGIGSMEYLESLYPPSEEVMESPSVPMPPLLEEYGDNIKQEFHNMNFTVFEEMLLNQNTNECR